MGTESRQKQSISNETLFSPTAVRACDLYMNAAINATEQLNTTYKSEMIYHLNISCLHDVMTTNDTTVSEQNLESVNMQESVLQSLGSFRKRS